MRDAPSLVALVPARQGSKRVTGKNIRALCGHPLIGYTIAAALESGVYDAVIASTDSEEIASIARHYGAEVPFLRPAALAEDTSPDIEFVEFTLGALAQQGRAFDCFSLLRPTSPFRSAETIRRAWRAFLDDPNVDSLRAVEKCHEHPGKMWVIRDHRLLPLLPFGRSESSALGPPPPTQPWHSTPYQALPEVYVQNASLEIGWTRIVKEGRTIAGETILPFLTRDAEGFDINDELDWMLAEHLLETGGATLPAIRQPAYPGR